jgi:hypothetical protein
MPSVLQLIVSCYGPFLSLKDAAECLHRSYEIIYALVRSGALRACRTGKNGGYMSLQMILQNTSKKFDALVNGLRIKSTGHFLSPDDSKTL